MFTRLFGLFFATASPAAADLEPIRAGARVIESDTGTPGVVAGTYTYEGVPVARVVFTGHRTSWVGIIAIERLVPCP